MARMTMPQIGTSNVNSMVAMATTSQAMPKMYNNQNQDMHKPKGNPYNYGLGVNNKNANKMKQFLFGNNIDQADSKTCHPESKQTICVRKSTDIQSIAKNLSNKFNL